MLIVRPAALGDLGALMELAILSGRGFTSLPEDEATLLDRLTLSAGSFSGAIAPREAWYTLMLEDSETGRIEGLCGVRAAVGVRRPHFSFRVMTLAQFSSAIDTRFDHQALVLVNECSGWTEVGSLYLRPERRSGGAGSLLARSRYMLIGAEPTRFSETVMAELRGYFAPDGICPFWEGVASKFFRLPFDQADHMVMSTDGQFILDLAPRHPIYVELIDEAAQDAIGKVHIEGEAARAMLEHEGFHGSGLIDIFDGGPTYSCARGAISTLQRTSAFEVAIGDAADAPELIVSTTSIGGFRATRAAARIEGGRATLNGSAADALKLKDGRPDKGKTMMNSIDPATGETIWEGEETAPAAIAAMVARARAALPGWSSRPIDDRVEILRNYASILKERTEAIARDISRETGKPLWETRGELASMIGKVEISIAAQAERAGSRSAAMPFGRAVLRHKPHGVMAVLGPYNFPGHLPNGHIVPALLAGNAVLFKPSEETPLTGQHMTQALRDAGVPETAFALVQGGRDQGAALIDTDIDGLLFTGSATTGAHFRKVMVDRPHIVLALELGGNNPLIAWGDADISAAAIVQSAFVTTGQRCSCARRLIVPEGVEGNATVEAVHTLASRLRIGAWNDEDEPYFGPLISARAAQQSIDAVAALVGKGAKALLPYERLERSEAFVTPGIYDVTGIDVPDAEIFAPILQIIRVPDFDAAIDDANATSFGLSAGLLSDDAALWERFLSRSRAGVVNWNRPTTGAAGNMPFGGLGQSGNHRPSAYYAADYCAYPVASFEAEAVVDLTTDLGGRLL